MITREQFDTVAGQFDFLQRADAPAIKEFQQAVTYARLPAGKRLFSEGDSAQSLALVVSGTVRVFKTGRTGREITLYRIGAGETCILSVNAILTQQPVPAAATVEERVEAVTIAAGVLRDWVHRHELWRRFVFELMSHRLTDVLGIVDTVVFRRMDARVATLLLERSGLVWYGGFLAGVAADATCADALERIAAACGAAGDGIPLDPGRVARFLAIAGKETRHCLKTMAPTTAETPEGNWITDLSRNDLNP